MTRSITAQHLQPGLTNPVFDSQRVFRASLEAFSRPGSAVHVPVPLQARVPISAAGAAFILAMLDFETPLWIQSAIDELSDFVRFHCNVPVVDEPRRARFALITDAASMPDLTQFDTGNAEYPDRSATLIVQVPRLSGGRRVRLSGPGIITPIAIEPSGLRPDFWLQWQRNSTLFPCGVDVLLVCGASLLALPRTTKAEV